MSSTSQRRGSFSVKHALSSLLSPSIASSINHTTSHSSNKSTSHSNSTNSKSQDISSLNKVSLSQSVDSDKLSDTINTTDNTNANANNNSNATTTNNDNNNDNDYILNQFLLSRGFINPRKIIENDTKDLSISVATTGQYVFLPTISSNDDEYLMQLNGFNDTDMFPDANVNIQNDIIDDLDSSALSNNNNNNNNNTNNSTNISNPRVTDIASDLNSDSLVSSQNDELDNSMTPYNIAIVLSLKQQMHLLAPLHVELCSRIKLFWHNGVPPSKTFDEEFYKCVSLKWDLNPSKPSFLIDTTNSIIMDNITTNDTENNNNNNNSMKRKFVTVLPNEQRYYIDKKRTKIMFFQDMASTKQELLEPGDYIFILPCIFSNHVPETLYYPSARVNYSLKIGTIQGHSTSIDFMDRSIEHPDETLRSRTSTIVSTTNVNDSIPSPNSCISLNKTELEKAQPKKLIKNGTAIFQRMKQSFHHISSSPEKGPLHISPSMELTKDHLFGEYPINVIRTPPLVSVSTANKPIYINRIWTNSLSYEISFAQKYVSLNSQVPIKIKLAPLEKNICIKRIRVSVNEKITFVSKNLEYEYDQVDPVAKDPYNPYYLDFQAKRRKERNLPLLEIRTQEKGARALREEIVENAFSDNLISYSAISDGSSKTSKNNKNDASIGITEPITIETVLDFPKFEDFDKRKARIIPPYGIDSFTMIPNPEHYHNHNNKNENLRRSSVIGILTGNHYLHHHGQNQSHTNQTDNNSTNSENNNNSNSNSNNSNNTIGSSQDNNKNFDRRFYQTKIKSNSGIEVKFHTKLNESKRGLYLDSMHFSNIHARHKLEIMLRISKPDPQDSSRLRHYEVLIDTPIYLVSEMCNSGNMELPTYHMATSSSNIVGAVTGGTFSSDKNIVIGGNPMNDALPPSFEEAISVPNSPLVSPIGSPNIMASYDPDNLYIQQLNLSRAISISGPSGAPQSISVLNTNNINNNNNGGGDDDDNNNITVHNSAEDSTNNTFTVKSDTQINYPNGNEFIFNNLDHVLNSSSLFKKDYKINRNTNDNNNNNDERRTPINLINDNVNPHSDVETLSDPPNYDEVVNI